MKRNIPKLFFLLFVTACLIVTYTCKKLEKEMMVSTGNVTNILTNSADASGLIIDLGEGATQRGHCYATTPNPTIAGTKTALGNPATGSFTSQLTNLEAGTKYYIKAYISNGPETVYGEEINFTTVAASVPTITTTAITSVTEISATSGGNITSDGGAAVTARGVCWNTATGPTTSNSKSTDGTGTGSFASSLTGLTPGTTYYVRAYATNSVGTAYGNELTFTTSALTLVVPTLSTTEITSITTTTATSGGNITSNGGSTVTASGVCWSTSVNPVATGSHTTDGTATGIFTSSITGLTANTTYYVRAYATNSIGTAYGNEISFTTNPVTLVVPTLTTTAASSITQTTATSGGNITSNGGATVTASGVCWSTSVNPVATGSHTTDGTATGAFTSSITGLTANTTYYVRAYATNSVGTAYGNEISFTTLLLAPAITNFPDITKNYGDAPFTLTAPTSNSTGTFTYSSGNAGVATIGNSTGLVTITGAGTSIITATQAATGSYASDFITATLTVNAILPALSTNDITNITSITATSGGNITGDGGATVIVRGVCWSTSTNPTIALPTKTSNGTGSGIFTSSITELSLGVTYFVRAYATNSAGTAYGNEVSFMALAIGDNYQGGIVAYILQSGDPGYIAGQTRGLIAAPSDQGIAFWGCLGTAISGADGTAIGTGNQNTVDILVGCTTADIAAKLCSDLVLGGYSDWYLPSRDELNKLYINRVAIGGFANSYWSSTETNDNFAWNQNFTDGTQNNYYGKNGSNYVRAIRAFPPVPVLPGVTTTAVSAITSTTATSGGNVLADGGAPVTARGVCWGTSPNPTLANSVTTNGNGSGIFSSSLTGLSTATTYYVKAYAINSAGTVYGDEVNFTTLCGSSLTVVHTAGTVAPVNKTVSYGTVKTDLTGTNKCWITQNLGADNQASSATDPTEEAAGWYWQFNRKQGYKNDGILTPSTTWVAPIDEDGNWSASEDPCAILLGTGWRIPTYSEWVNADNNGGWSDYNVTYASVLKLHAAGFLDYFGAVDGRGIYGLYVSTLQRDNTFGFHLSFGNSSCDVVSSLKVFGKSVRCIRD